MRSNNRRREMDIMKLMKSGHNVYTSDNISEFWVEFRGPKGTPYEDGVWMMHVILPSEYPFKSPSIGFANRIFHPNVDEESGSVCLDVINQKWTAMYDLQVIFDTFLPQLLRYPNPDDPLNSAAALHLRQDPVSYYSKLQAHIAEYATLARAFCAIPDRYRPRTESNAVDDATQSSRPSNGNKVNGSSGNGHDSVLQCASPVSQSEAALNSNGDTGVTTTAMTDETPIEDDDSYVPDEIEL